jgi:hypothetical protein
VDVSDEAHAMDRMVQSGAQPMTSVQYPLESRRYWARYWITEMTTPGNGHKFDDPGVMALTYRPDHRISGVDIYLDRLTVDQQLGVDP